MRAHHIMTHQVITPRVHRRDVEHHVRNGIVHLSGIITDERCRQAAIVAAENVPGVRQVHDELCSYPPDEEELGGGDFVSIQQEPPTVDDAPL